MSHTPPIILISALSTNNAIGKNNHLPWDLPNDMRRFKQLTLGNPIIMGRKTFESMPGILPRRKNIVLSNTRKTNTENLFFVSKVSEALEQAKGADKIYVIGGSYIYTLFLDIATHMELTHVHHVFEDADVFFPNVDYSKWILVNQEPHLPDTKHAFAYTFSSYLRK